MTALCGGFLNLEAADSCEHSLSGFLQDLTNKQTNKTSHNFSIDERMKYWLHYSRVLPNVYSGSFIHIRDKT